MTPRDWWKSAVVYQVYRARSFAYSDGDGVADLGGVIAHVDHLHGLGVDVVWLSPVYRSPMADNGYDISGYEDVARCLAPWRSSTSSSPGCTSAKRSTSWTSWALLH